MNTIKNQLLSSWDTYKKKNLNSFSMIASENVISPLASLACASDFHNRYFFDNEILWGEEAFSGSKLIKEIQRDILTPLLKKYTKANYINAKPLSGLNCMLIVMSSYCKQGDTIFSIAPEMGGHTSTQDVAEKIYIKNIYVPYLNCYDIDYPKLENQLLKHKPKLVYIDQANCLFTIDIRKISKLIKNISPETYLHVDSSHTNGLIFGDVLPNPIDSGATSFGGSTHKTFPGPQKAFIATSNEEIAKSIENTTMHLVSNCHTGNIIALCVALIEFDECNGKEYAEQIIKNSKIFAEQLNKGGIKPEAEERGFTETHQVWIDPKKYGGAKEILNYLYEAGIFINAFHSLPGIEGIGYRVGLNEATRFGMKESNISVLADVFLKAFFLKDLELSKKIVAELKQEFELPAYCYKLSVNDLAITQHFK